MTTNDLRAVIQAQLKSLGIKTHRAAILAGIPDQTVRDFLNGSTDIATGKMFLLAAAIGLKIGAKPAKIAARDQNKTA